MENVYVDIETSGLCVGEEGKKDARILRISAIKTDADNNITDRFDTFVACGGYLPKCVREVTGISNTLLKGAPRTRAALKSFKEFAGDSTLISYNIAFDMSFLKFYGKKYGIKFDNPEIDLLSLAKEQLNDKVQNFTIKSVADFLGIPLNKPDVDIICEIGAKLK